MIYLLWGLLNLLLLFFLCYFIYKAAKRKWGGFWAFISVLLTIGITSVLNSRGGEEEPNSSQLKTWQLISKDSLDQSFTTSTDLELDKNILHSYNLGILWCSRKGTETRIPASAYTLTNGYRIGTKWIPFLITTSPSNIEGSYQYDVIGTVEWSIIGIKLYSQTKRWSGIVSSK